MTKKRAITNIFIYNIIFFSIFYFVSLYIKKNEFLIENIDSLSFFICIVIVATSHILTCQYSNLTKFAYIYIYIMLISITSFNIFFI